MTLRSYLQLLTLATVLPVAAFALVVGALLIDTQRDTFRRGAEERTLAVLSAVEIELHSSIATTEALAASPTLDERDLERFRVVAASVLSTQRDWSTVNLALPSGQQIMNLNVPPGEALPLVAPADASFARVVETGKPAVGDIVYGPTTKAWDFAVRVPILRDGAVRYVLSAVISPRSILEILATQRLPADWIGMVVDRNNRIVARTANADRSVGSTASENLHKALAASPSGVFFGTTLEGAKVYVPYARSQATGWAFGMQIPADAVDRVGRRAQWTLALGLLAALALALGVALAVGRRIARPISSLAETTKAMGHGEPLALPREIPVDEVRTLAAAMERAARAIGERRDLMEREQDALRAADRAKDEFLAMLSHELRTPLAAMTTAAHVLRVARDNTERAGEARGVIERQTRHMAQLIEDLLDVSRVSLGKAQLQREALDLGELVENLWAGWRDAKRFARHEVSHAIASVWIDADRTRIEQIVSNLLDNALKFTPPGRGIEVSVRQDRSEAVLEVRDEGEGITPEDMNRIFDLFAQGEQGLDRRRGGMGIGLALVKRLAEMHGGTVSVSSKGAARGARFTVRLPAIVGPHRRPERMAPERKTAPRRILIIEDNDDTRHMLREALALGGHFVQEAHDGASGLAAALSAPPDLALIDIGLPDMDGYEVARRLRAGPLDGRVPLIALSGYGRPADLKRAFEAGFNSHLTKPVAIEQLHSAIGAFG